MKKFAKKKTNKTPDDVKLQHGIENGYRSGLEDKVAEELKSLGIPVEYESFKIAYTQPEKKRKYTPDFLLPNGIIVETKGRFTTADRQKHLLVKDQHPLLDIRFVFSNPNNRISKGSETTYAMWCERNGFQYAKKSIPIEWIKEPNKKPTSGQKTKRKGD